MNRPSSQVRQWQFSAATGKPRFEMQRVQAQNAMNSRDDYVYIITRKEIESCDISYFLGTLDIQNAPKKLRELQGRVLFTVNGFDDTDEPLFTIPSVRRFFQKCHEWWACWSFYGQLRSDCLAAIACCILPTITTVRFPHGKVKATLPHADLIAFFESTLPAAACLHTRAKIDRNTGMKLLQGVSYYLQLPDTKI